MIHKSLRDGGLAEKREKTEVIHLTKNYRSFRKIVDFMNLAISGMGLPDLLAANQAVDGGRWMVDGGEIRILDFESEEAERDFVVREIVDGDYANEDIFVLARTNRALLEMSEVMKKRGVAHFVKEESPDGRGEMVDGRASGKVTLATVHAIKGLEARKVFVIGVNEQNFPCKASDHPAIEMLKKDDYDREEEERRLFYVAISRAKESLVVSYSGKKPSYYISEAMRRMASGEQVAGSSEEIDLGVDEGLVGELKSWRLALSEERGVPAYVILTNKTIDEIAVKKPRSAEELAKISGIGPEKLVKYGGKILEIVGDFR